MRSPRLPLPWVPAALSVWQPEQWVAKRTAPSWLGSSSETEIPFFAEAAGGKPEGGERRPWL